MRAGHGRRGPPGPRGWPLLGLLPALRRDPLGVFAAAAREHGDLVRLPAGPHRLYLLNHPDHIRRVLQDNHRNYRRTRPSEKLKLVLGEGLVTSEGERWARQRRLIQPAFEPERLRAFAPAMTAATDAMLERWQGFAAAAQPFDAAAEMGRLALAIVTRALFGAEIGRDADAIGHALAVAQAYTARRLLALADFPERLPTARNRRFREARRTLDETVRRLIDARMRARRVEAAGRDDLLGLLIAARDPETGAGMAPGQIRDEAMTMLLAGHETTANALAWALHLLALDPPAADRLAGEAETVLGARAPTPEDMARLVHTRRAVQEAMRLYPPVWRIARAAIADDRIGGYAVPAGSIVILCQFLMHRHPGFWERPDSFDPDRFAPERSAGRPRHAYFPFAGGPHSCIGAQFATMETTLVLPMILRRFRLRPLPGHPVEPQPLITLRPKHGLMMLAAEREGR